MSLGCFQRFLLNSISKKEYSFSPIPISPPHKIFLQQYPLHYSPYTPPSHILLIFSQLPLPSSFSLFPVVTGGTQDAGERASAAGAPWPSPILRRAGSRVGPPDLPLLVRVRSHRLSGGASRATSRRIPAGCCPRRRRADAAAVTSSVSARKALAADEEGEPAEGKYLCVFQGQWTIFDPLFYVSCCVKSFWNPDLCFVAEKSIRVYELMLC